MDYRTGERSMTGGVAGLYRPAVRESGMSGLF